MKGQEKYETHTQIRRSRLFERISEERARNRSLFIEVSDADLGIAEILKAENVLYEYNEKYSFQFHQSGKKGCSEVRTVLRLPTLTCRHLLHYPGEVLMFQYLYFPGYVVGCIGR